MPISMKFTFGKRCKDQTRRCSEITQENFKINKNCNKATKNSSCHSFLVLKPFFLLMKTSETFFRYKNWEFLEEYELGEFIKTLLFSQLNAYQLFPIICFHFCHLFSLFKEIYTKKLCHIFQCLKIFAEESLLINFQCF